jgi:UMF1 family MFS transporter
MLSMLTPHDRQAEFFGFYTLTGRLSSIIGPILYGWIAHVSGDIRYSILSLLLFFLTGWIALQFVNPIKGLTDAGNMMKTQTNGG